MPTHSARFMSPSRQVDARRSRPYSNAKSPWPVSGYAEGPAAATSGGRQRLLREGRPRLRADDSVVGKSCGTLELAHGALGGGAEFAIGNAADTHLDPPHVVAGGARLQLRPLGGHGLAEQRRLGPRSDDSVIREL